VVEDLKGRYRNGQNDDDDDDDDDDVLIHFLFPVS